MSHEKELRISNEVLLALKIAIKHENDIEIRYNAAKDEIKIYEISRKLLSKESSIKIV